MYDSLFSTNAFSDKVVLITGSTSGIGRETAIAFASHGAHVMVSGRDRSRGEEVLQKIIASGGSAKLLIGDVSDSRFCTFLINETIKSFGALNVLFNNAGIVMHGQIESHTDDDWKKLIDINLNSMFFLSRTAIPYMKTQGGGVIINMSSECGVIGYKNLAAYSATKSAIIMFTKVLALDHASDNIRINAVCPGDIDTPMMDMGWENQNLSSQAIRDALRKHIPIGRVGESQDIAATVMFLASDLSGFITGVALPIDGGTTAR